MDWSTKLARHIGEHGYTRMETTLEAEERWDKQIKDMYGAVLVRKARSWFTGYNSNIEAHEYGSKPRYLVYGGSAPG